MSRVLVDGRALRPAAVRPPVSKSDALRALTLANAVGLPAPAIGGHPPADVVALARGLEVLRLGTGDPIACGDGAAPFRILLGQAAVRPGTTRLTGSPRLAERPHEPLVAALLETLEPGGLRISRGTPWPWVIEGTASAARRSFRVNGTASSQFATSLLLAAAVRAFQDDQPWAVELQGPSTSAGYLDLTLAWLRRAGLRVDGSADTVTVRRGERPQTLGNLPADWSSASYLLAVAWRSGGQVLGLDWQALQPDRAVVRVLREAGLAVEQGPAGEGTVRGLPTRGLQASALECPDLIPTLAVLACALPQPSTLTDLGVLRHKESDRLQGILDLLAALSANTDLHGSTLTVTAPAEPPDRVSVPGRGDHRQVMAAATAAVVLGIQVEIDGAEHVEKSFPGFFEELSRSGVIVC